MKSTAFTSVWIHVEYDLEKCMNHQSLEQPTALKLFSPPRKPTSDNLLEGRCHVYRIVGYRHTQYSASFVCTVSISWNAYVKYRLSFTNAVP